MVLLTSSAVSVAVSSAIICLFTFLLFLSGYVLQQQSVRALQLALHPPPQPTPTLPTYFQEIRNGEHGVDAEGEIKPEEEGTESNQQTTVGQNAAHSSDDQVVLAQPEPDGTSDAESKPEDGQAPPAPILTESSSEEVSSSSVQALILSIVQASDVCSAILFYRTVSQFTGSDLVSRKLVFYPSFWQENESRGKYVEALHLLDQAKEDLHLETQSINIPLEYQTSSAAVERHIKDNLLFSHEILDLSKAIYFQTPGLVLDAAKLVEAISAPIEDSWGTASPTAASTSGMLLFSKSPANVPINSNVMLKATTSHAEENTNEEVHESLPNGAAYLTFEKEVLKQSDSGFWYSGFVEQYQAEIRDVCSGALLEREDVKGELKREEVSERSTRRAA